MLLEIAISRSRATKLPKIAAEAVLTVKSRWASIAAHPEQLRVIVSTDHDLQSFSIHTCRLDLYARRVQLPVDARIRELRDEMYAEPYDRIGRAPATVWP